MKIRVIISATILIIWAITTSLLNLLVSPISGIATAQQLNDTIESFVWAKFVSNGGLNIINNILWFGFLVMVWIKPIFRYGKTSL